MTLSRWSCFEEIKRNRPGSILRLHEFDTPPCAGQKVEEISALGWCNEFTFELISGNEMIDVRSNLIALGAIQGEMQFHLWQGVELLGDLRFWYDV